jgi:outer membrane protein TolC
MKLLKMLLIFLLAFVPAAQISSQNNTKPDSLLKFSLQEALQYAIDHNYTVKNSVADIEIAKKRVWETTAIGLPQVNVDAQYSNIFKVPVVSFPSTAIKVEDFPDGTPFTSQALEDNLSLGYEDGEPIALGVKENITATLVVSQLIFSGEYIVGLQASRTFRLVTEQSLIKSELEIKQLVYDSYHLVLVLRESQKIGEEILTNIEKTEFEVRESLKAGFVEETDLDQIILTKTQLKNSVENITRQVEVAVQLLKFQMGLEYNATIELTENLDQLVNSVNAESLLIQQLILGDNIDFQLISTREKLNELAWKLEKARFLPSVAGFYQHQERANKPDFDFVSPDMIGVSLTLPIFSSGSRLAKVSQARLNYEKMQNSREQVVQGIYLELSQARTNFENAVETYNNQRMNITIAKKIYDRSLIKYREGLTSSLELTTANNQYLEAQSSYFQDMLQLLNAKIKLNKVLNTL